MDNIVGKGYDLTRDNIQKVRIEVTLSDKLYDITLFTNTHGGKDVPVFLAKRTGTDDKYKIGAAWLNESDKKCKYLSLTVLLDEINYRLFILKRRDEHAYDDGEHQFIVLLKKSEPIKSEPIL